MDYPSTFTENFLLFFFRKFLKRRLGWCLKDRLSEEDLTDWCADRSAHNPTLVLPPIWIPMSDGLRWIQTASLNKAHNFHTIFIMMEPPVTWITIQMETPKLTCLFRLSECAHTYRAAVVSDNCNIRGWVALLCGCNHWIWKVPSPLTRPYLQIDINTGYIRVFPSVELTCNFKHSWQNTFHFPLYPDIIVGLALTSNKEKKNLKPFSRPLTYSKRHFTSRRKICVV